MKILKNFLTRTVGVQFNLYTPFQGGEQMGTSDRRCELCVVENTKQLKT